MQLQIHGELVDYEDNAALKSHSRAHAINKIRHLKSKELRQAFESFYTDLYFMWLKANAVVFLHEVAKDTTASVDELKEVLDYIREILGESPPRGSLTTDEENADGVPDGTDGSVCDAEAGGSDHVELVPGP